jgi:hypothetical protein
MISGAQIRKGQFVEVGWRLPRCLGQFQRALVAEVDNTREGS